MPTLLSSTPLSILLPNVKDEPRRDWRDSSAARGVTVPALALAPCCAICGNHSIRRGHSGMSHIFDGTPRFESLFARVEPPRGRSLAKLKDRLHLENGKAGRLSD